MTNEKVYILHRGYGVDGRDAPANVFFNQEDAEETYGQLVQEGIADLNVGLYVTEVSDLTDTEVKEIVARPAALVETGFEGVNSRRIAEHASQVDAWDNKALVDDDDFLQSDEDDTLIHL